MCLLYVAAIPWQIGLAKVPGLDALVFSIPYTAVLLIGLRLVPKPGAATVLVFGARRADRPLARRLHCCQGGTNSSFHHRISNDADLTQGSTAAMSRLLDLSNEGYISGLYQDDPSYRIIFVRQNLEDRRRSRRTTAERIPLPPVSEHPRSVKSRVEPRH